MADAIRNRADLMANIVTASTGNTTAQDVREIAYSSYNLIDEPLLATFAALTITSNTLIHGTGSASMTVVSYAANTFPARGSSGNLVAKTITDFGLSLVDDADAAAGRATLSAASLAANSFAGDQTVTGDVILSAAGNGVKVKEGSNATMGTGVLVAGTVTINTTKVTANSRIFLTVQVAGGTQGILSVGTVTAGTSFVINSTNAADTSTVAWIIVEPSP